MEDGRGRGKFCRGWMYLLQVVYVQGGTAKSAKTRPPTETKTIVFVNATAQYILRQAIQQPRYFTK